MPDYLIDARISKLPVTSLRDFLKSSGKCLDDELSRATTKFALISLAENKQIELEPLLANIVARPGGSPANTGRKSSADPAPASGLANLFGWFTAPADSRTVEQKKSSSSLAVQAREGATAAANAAAEAQAGAEKIARQTATRAAEKAAAEAAIAQQAAEEALRTAKAMEATIAEKKAVAEAEAAAQKARAEAEEKAASEISETEVPAHNAEAVREEAEARAAEAALAAEAFAAAKAAELAEVSRNFHETRAALAEGGTSSRPRRSPLPPPVPRRPRRRRR